MSRYVGFTFVTVRSAPLLMQLNGDDMVLWGWSTGPLRPARGRYRLQPEEGTLKLPLKIDTSCQIHCVRSFIEEECLVKGNTHTDTTYILQNLT